MIKEDTKDKFIAHYQGESLGLPPLSGNICYKYRHGKAQLAWHRAHTDLRSQCSIRHRRRKMLCFKIRCFTLWDTVKLKILSLKIKSLIEKWIDINVSLNMEFFNRLKSLKTQNSEYKGRDRPTSNRPPQPSKENGSCRNIHHYQERYVQADNYDPNQEHQLCIKGKRNYFKHR